MDVQDNLQPEESVQSSKNTLIILACVFVTALAVGGSMYVWQKSVLKSTEQNLNSQIVVLQSQLTELKAKIDEKVNDNKSDEVIRSLNTEEELVKRTLINFFSYLEKGDFEDAVKLFHQDDWEQLNLFSAPSELGSKAKVLENYCIAVDTCMQAEVLSVTANKPNVEYSLVVQFMQADGSIYIFGPCCGATEEEMPPQRQFTFEVKKIGGEYKVITPPLYRP